MPKQSGPWFRANPLFVGVVYVLVSILWIVFSDKLVRIRAVTPDNFMYWSMAKGIVFVSVSAFLIYVLMQRVTASNQILETVVKARTEALRTSEARYRRILETAQEGVWIFDRQDRTEFVNQRMAEMLGYPAEEIAGTSLMDFVDARWKEDAARILQHLRTGSPESGEIRLHRKDGLELWAFVSGSPLLDEHAHYNGAMALVSDIGERKRAEETLQLQATALTAAANAIVITSPDGKILWTNPAFTRLTGYEPAEVIGQNDSILDSGKHSPEFYRELWSKILDGQVWHGEMTNRRKDGRLYDVEMTIAPVRSPTGAVTHFIAIKQDVTARNQAQEDLRRSEELFRLAFEQGPLGVILVARDRRLLKVNQAFCQMLGYRERELLALTVSDITHPEDLERDRRVAERILKGEVPSHRWQKRYLKKSGEPVVVEVLASLVRDENGKPLYALGMITNITGQKRAEEALLQAEAKYREMFENAVEGICQITPSGQGLSANQAFATIFGFDTPGEAIQHISDISRQVYVDAAKREEISRALAKDEVVQHFECEACRRDGSRMWLLANVRATHGADGKILSYEGTIQDVTDRKTLELQLRQAQKLEAVGRLAGGVAHDFNNMLGVIIGYGDIVQTQLPPEHPASRNTIEMQKAARRAADLTRQLLAFSRRQVLQPQVLNLNSLLDELGKMLRRMIGEDIEFVFRPGPEVARVKADPGQLEQVVMNLAVNAKDAMPRGGRLLIETANVEVDEDFAHRHAPMRPGSYVLLSATDTGSGMDGKTLSHIFEPFFTTKEQGKGTGLGLSIVYGIIKQSGGYIWVDSEPNRGSSFRIYLPPTAEAETAVTAFPRPSSIGGTETILVVEDDTSLREIIRMILTATGYRILEAPNGAEALSLLRGTSESVHLLVTDIIMPGKVNGWDLAQSAAAIKPAMRTLFMTGFGGELDTFGIAIAPDVMLIAKPFSSDALLRKVRETLDMRAGAKSAVTSL